MYSRDHWWSHFYVINRSSWNLARNSIENTLNPRRYSLLIYIQCNSSKIPIHNSWIKSSNSIPYPTNALEERHTISPSHSHSIAIYRYFPAYLHHIPLSSIVCTWIHQFQHHTANMKIAAYSHRLLHLQIRDEHPQIPGIIADVNHRIQRYFIVFTKFTVFTIYLTTSLIGTALLTNFVQQH